jgi:hypothetical protein
LYVPQMIQSRIRYAVGISILLLATTAATTSAAAPGSLVGTWTRVNSCAALVRSLESAGLHDHLVDTLVGGGYFSSASQVRAAAPCTGARGNKHSHFFTAGHAFGSRDERGKQVDDGDYNVIAANTLSFPSHAKEFGYKVTVHYSIAGGKLSFRVVVPKPCRGKCRDATAWAISAFYAGPLFTSAR